MNGLNDRIFIEGGHKLKGNVQIQGSKNAALPMMAASLLHRGVSVLKGCPRIADVFCMEEILQNLGAVTWWEDHDLYLDCTKADKTEVPFSFTGRMRSSVILLGALLGRNKKGSLGYPGGCVIGKRPIDMHLLVLESLGARIQEVAGQLSAECERMKGTEFSFPKRSVGATQQGILGAVLAKGETVLENCACEPEISWLCHYLRTMGAQITGDGTGRICVSGVEGLRGGSSWVPPDRIVAGTYICAAAITRSEITLTGPPEGELDSFLEVYRKIGGQYQVNGGTLEVNGKNAVRPAVLVETEIYPGFPTDLQAPLMAVLTGAQGQSTIRENIFDQRFGSAFQMKKMGADISVSGNQAIIRGGKTLKGTQVQAGDLRGGAALLIAALMAEGETCVTGAGFISRGYEHICEDLRTLGCRIWQPGTEDLRIYERK